MSDLNLESGEEIIQEVQPPLKAGAAEVLILWWTVLYPIYVLRNIKQTRFVLTTNRFIKQQGSDTTAFHLDAIERVETSQATLQKPLGIGTLVVETGAETTEFDIVPNHTAVAQAIRDQQLN